MFVTSRLLEMGFSMRHIYWAMEAAGTALWRVSVWYGNIIIIIFVLFCYFLLMMRKMFYISYIYLFHSVL